MMKNRTHHFSLLLYILVGMSLSLLGVLFLINLSSNFSSRPLSHEWNAKRAAASCFTRSWCLSTNIAAGLELTPPPFMTSSRCGNPENVSIIRLDVSPGDYATGSLFCYDEKFSAVFSYRSMGVNKGSESVWVKCRNSNCENAERDLPPY